jgi:iron complex transport system substrate-binding protein
MISEVLVPLLHRSHRLRRLRSRGVLAGLAPLALALAACGGGPTAGEAQQGVEGSATAFEPVTIEHAFGRTTIEEQPDRVVSWGWASADAAIALGEVPVAMPRFSYGADEQGFMPWTREALQRSGEELPTLLSETQEAPYEEIAEAAPDVILANYSGITREEYDTLSKIAPTIAYPDQPWATPWRHVVTTVGKVLGKEQQAVRLLDRIDAEVAAAAKRHPEFRGLSAAAVAVEPSAFYVYKSADPRVQFLEDLGFVTAPSVDRLATDESSFFYTLSFENLDQLRSDVLVSYSPSDQRARQVVASEPLQLMPQVRDGSVASIAGEEYVASVSPPTALSLTWGLDEFVTQLSAAAKAARAS